MKHTKIRYLEIVMVILLTLVISACNQARLSEKTGYVENNTLNDYHPRARLILGSQALVGNIHLANVQFRKVGLFTQAQVGVQNLSGIRYNLEYKVEWEDKNGFMVDQSGVWHRFTLAPSQIETVTATGKVEEAYKIVFTVRLPDDPFIINNKK